MILGAEKQRRSPERGDELKWVRHNKAGQRSGEKAQRTINQSGAGCGGRQSREGIVGAAGQSEAPLRPRDRYGEMEVREEMKEVGVPIGKRIITFIPGSAVERTVWYSRGRMLRR